ncbi:TPA: hypothetical protein ACX6SL_001113 [Photobacterium damselae]
MYQKSLFMPEEQKNIVTAHNTFSNDVVGVFAFGMGISSLASGNPAGLASISFLFCCIWMIHKGVKIFSTLRRAYSGIPCWKQCIDSLLDNSVYFIGLGFVGLVAFEVITNKTLENFSLASMFALVQN